MPAKLVSLLLQAIEIYSYLLIIWVIGSWFPQLHGTKFYRWVESVVYPYTKIFRGLIPPIGGFDFSVILAFIVLEFLKNLIASLAHPMI